MKILFLINFYPPYERGGEELSFQSIVNGLHRRGHDVEVITSNYGSARSIDGVYRDFLLEMESKPLLNFLRFFTQRKMIIRRDEVVLHKHIEAFEPDIIFVGSMWNIPRHVPALAEELLREKVVYRLANYWPALGSQYSDYWKTKAKTPYLAIIKKVLGNYALRLIERESVPALKLRHTICISEAIREELTRMGVNLRDVRVVHNGIDISKFKFDVNRWQIDYPPTPLKILYVGRIASEKGIDTAIKSLSLLKDRRSVSLTIAGPIWDRKYYLSLKELAQQLNVASHVQYIGQQPFDAIPEIMSGHDVLVVPSVWPEPFGRVVLEGMAAGILVVGTAQGGMGVALRNGITGLVFPPKDSQALAEIISHLVIEPCWAKNIIEKAREEVSTHFTEGQMVDNYEQCLIRVCDGKQLDSFNTC